MAVLEGFMKGRVIQHIADQYVVEVENKTYWCKARGKFRIQEEKPVVGDLVEVRLEEGMHDNVIEQIYPRKNYSKRPKMSNLDQLIFVVSSKMPKPDLFMLDKQLVFASFLGMDAVIVVNKQDLDEAKSYQEIKKVYEPIGYPVMGTNAKLGEGKEELKQRLEGKINAFSGNSGVGKSTLLNCLFKKELSKEGVVSKKNKKGKNTTTAISLYELQPNTYIADTPGFSTFSIEEIPAEELDQYFIEFCEYLPFCEYAGCNHIKEEKCGVKKAVEHGKIADSRYEHYKTLYLELKEKEEHRW